MDCPHLIDEDGKCTECGVVVQPHINLGDIVGICQLLDNTVAAYATLVHNNTDPKDPSKPRLRVIGGRVIRLPHSALLKDLVYNSYPRAKQLGYRGSIIRWGEMILENKTVTDTSAHH